MNAQYEMLKLKLTSETHRWLVTGAAGFIGSHLVETLLAHGQQVVGIDNFATGFASNLEDIQQRVGEKNWQRFRFIEGDVTDALDCARACDGAEFVLHQAALGSVPRSVKDPFASHDTNVTGFLQMLIAARDANVRAFVYASSSSVYGDHPMLPKVEEQIGEPLSPYAGTKRMNELYANIFARTYKLPAVGLRYFNIFGRRQSPAGAYAAVIPKWFANLIHGEPCVIFGDGETSRDFTHVSNAVQANLLAAMAAPKVAGMVFNIACGGQYSLNELHSAMANAVSEYFPATLPATPVYQEFRSGDIRHSLANIQAAQTHLGYSPEVSLNEGLKETLLWHIESMKEELRAS